jgi:hypothetical protein
MSLPRRPVLNVDDAPDAVLLHGVVPLLTIALNYFYTSQMHMTCRLEQRNHRFERMYLDITWGWPA